MQKGLDSIASEAGGEISRKQKTVTGIYLSLKNLGLTDVRTAGLEYDRAKFFSSSAGAELFKTHVREHSSITSVHF